MAWKFPNNCYKCIIHIPKEEINFIDKFNKLLSPTKIKACESNAVATYGLEELNEILELFSRQESAMVDAERARNDLLQYKQFVRRSEFATQNQSLCVLK